MTLIRALFVTALIGSTVGCVSGAASLSSTPQPAQSPASATAPATPSAAPDSPRLISSPSPDSKPLAGGTWRSQNFVVPFEFEVSEGAWKAWVDADRFFFMRQTGGGHTGIALVWAKVVYDHPCTHGHEDSHDWPKANGPREFFDFLAAESPVDWGKPEKTKIAGMDALTIDRVVPNGAFAACADEYFPMIDVGVEPPGEFSLPRYGQQFTLSAVEIGSQTILIAAIADQGAGLAESQRSMNAVLESLTFTN